MQVFITGMGIISGIGTGTVSTARALKNEQTGIRSISNLAAPQTDMLAAEAKESNASLKDILKISKHKKLSRTSLLGIIAAREALAGLSSNFKKDLPFISSTTTGGMDISESFYRNYIKEQSETNFK